MTNPVSGSGTGSLPAGQSILPKPTSPSSTEGASQPASDTAPTPLSQAVQSLASETAVSSNPAATIDLSPRGQAAQALMRGADHVAKGYSSAALESLATQISNGIYSPPPESVAKALVSYELRLLKGS